MRLPGRVWIISGIVSVIVVAGFLTLPQAPVASAETDQMDCLSSGCHKGRVLEIHDILGVETEACWSCHDNTLVSFNPEAGIHISVIKLHLADGTLLSPTSDSPQLCGQCHQERYNAWEERAPEIPGTTDIAKCTDCHNPHKFVTPRYDIIEPHPLAAPTTTTTPPPTTTTTPPPTTTTTPPPITTTTPPPTTTTTPPPTTTTTPPPTTTTTPPPPTTTTPPPTTTTTPPSTTTTPPPDDGESSLNMLVVVGSVLGVLVAGGMVYYFVKK